MGYIPKSISESVGSDHKISTTNYYSGVNTSCITSKGLYNYSISYTECKEDPIPPCKHIILSSIIVAKGNHSNNLLTL